MFSPQPDRRAYDAEWQKLLSPSTQATFQAISDPLAAGATQRGEIGGQLGGIKIAFGVIVDACAYVHGYRVFLSNGSPPRICTPLVQTSLGAIGMRQSHTYTPGTGVYVLFFVDLEVGLILGASPALSISANSTLPDAISQASRCGISVDLAHSSLLNMTGGFNDLSGGRPSDSLPIGEFGVFAETGMRIFGDAHMLSVAADEFSGLWVFYDQLVRLGGRHLQIDTAGSSEETLDDQGEIYHYRGITPYPWEELGRYSPGNPTRTISDQASQIDLPHYAPLEPLDDRQTPFHRIVTLSGYIGHGTKTYVFLPPAAATGVNTVGGKPPIAVAEDHTALTGRRSIRSAKSLILGKWGAIPGPTPLKRPEDATGDNPANYRFAGIGAAGDAHQVAGDVKTSDADDPVGQRMAALDDVLAHALNYEGVQPLFSHAKDWKLPEESATLLGGLSGIPSFATLASEQSIPPPKAQPIVVDHRYGKTDYFPNNAMLVFLEEGQVVIVDGFGGEIRMGGGGIRLACPLDIELAPGRNLVCLAGHDAIVRAKNSIDLSATNHDLRLKAKVNVQIVGGVGGSGGVLIESKGSAAYDYAKTGEDAVSGGVQIKSASEVAVWGSDVYLRTTTGELVLDAAAGAGDLIVTADTVTRYIRSSAVDSFGNPTAPTAVNDWGQNNLVSGSFQAGGNVAFGGSLLVNNDVVVASGNFGSSEAQAAGGKIGSLAGTGLNDARRSLDRQKDAITELQASLASNYTQSYDARWYAPGAAGNSDTIARTGFSFRGIAQYLTKKWRFWESRWQQQARLSSGTPATWTEQPVVSGSEKTYPYPGLEAWAQGDALRRQNLNLFDPIKGVSKDRTTTLYANPTLATADKVKPDGNYVVIV